MDTLRRRSSTLYKYSFKTYNFKLHSEFPPRDNLQLLSSQTHLFFLYIFKSFKETHACTERTFELQPGRSRLEFNPATFRLGGNCSTAPPYIGARLARHLRSNLRLMHGRGRRNPMSHPHKRFYLNFHLTSKQKFRCFEMGFHATVMDKHQYVTCCR